MIPASAKPADLILVDFNSDGGRLIRVLQFLNGNGFGKYEHVAIYAGNGKLLEAGGGGIHEGPAGKYDGNDTMWSTGIINPSDAQRAAIVKAAYSYAGTGYSWLDYAAIAAHRLHVPAPGLKAYIASTGHMICSQYADQAYQDGGYQLFDDGRWPGYVTPGDIWQLLTSKQKTG